MCNEAILNYLTTRFFFHKRLPYSVHAADLCWGQARLCQKASAVGNNSASGDMEENIRYVVNKKEENRTRTESLLLSTVQ